MNTDIRSRYKEPHRFYHTTEHCDRMWYDYVLSDAYSRGFKEDYKDDVILQCAINCHDAVYDPRRSDNEERSCDLVDEVVNSEYYGLCFEDIHHIKRLIRMTDPKTYDDPCADDLLVGIIRYLDCKALYDSDLNAMIKNFHLLLREFQFTSYENFKQGTLDFIDSFMIRMVDPDILKIYRSYVESYRPRIGLYVGLFNSFHIGHMSVLEQAEKVFDKVIVAYPERALQKPFITVEETLPFHEVISFTGLLCDFVKDKDLTIVRGLRNSTDLDYETNLKQVYRDHGITQDFMYFTTDYSHVSGTVIRSMINDDKYKMYIPTKFNYARRK